MAVNFPDSPSVDDVFTSGDNSFVWNGTSWKGVEGLEASILAGAETIFVASTTTDFHGSAGTSTSMAWVATTNNTSYIDSFTNNDTLITAEGAQEWDVHASVWCTNSAVNDRAIYLMRLVHETSGAVEIYEYILGGTYVRDDTDTYDSGGVGGHIRLFVSDGDRIKVQMYVVDTQNAAGSAPADASFSKVKIDRVTYS